MNSRERIDAHVHVWTDDTAAYPFGPHDGLAAPAEEASASRLAAAMDDAGVTQALAIQPRVYGYDHAYLLAAAQLAGRLRVMPLINVVRPTACEEMEALARHPAVAGFRVVVGGHRSAAAMLAAPASRVWSRLADLQRPVGLLTEPDLLPAVAETAERHPDLRIVLDHLGRIEAASWHQHGPVLLDLARLPNLYVKVSAVGYLSGQPSPYDDLRRPVTQLLESYGADRLLWGSDWPHAYEYGTYADSYRSVEEALTGASDAELDRIRAGTARQLFGFPHASSSVA